MTTGSVHLHRVLPAPPERVYRAFLDAGAMAKWLPPNGFTGKAFGGTYVELTPNERIRYTNRFDDPNLPGEMQTTISLSRVSCGTDLNVVQEGIPGVIPVESCHLG